MMSLLRNIRLQERQKRVRPSDISSSVAAFNGGYRSSGGNRFGRIVLGELRCKVDRKDGSLGLRGGGELFYRTDVIVGCLKARRKKGSE